MPIELRPIAIPDFGETIEEPRIPAETYDRRATEAYAAAGCDWLIVYGDLEHFANMAFLCGHDPRFEEALLCLGPGGKRYAIVGNEGGDQLALAGLPGLEPVLAQSLSLPGMDRSHAPKLVDALRGIGIKPGPASALLAGSPWRQKNMRKTARFSSCRTPLSWRLPAPPAAWARSGMRPAC